MHRRWILSLALVIGALVWLSHSANDEVRNKQAVERIATDTQDSHFAEASEKHGLYKREGEQRVRLLESHILDIFERLTELEARLKELESR